MVFCFLNEYNTKHRKHYDVTEMITYVEMN